MRFAVIDIYEPPENPGLHDLLVWSGSLREWTRNNGCDRAYVADICRDLRENGETMIGGGAAPAFRIVRTDSPSRYCTCDARDGQPHHFTCAFAPDYA